MEHKYDSASSDDINLSQHNSHVALTTRKFVFCVQSLSSYCKHSSISATVNTEQYAYFSKIYGITFKNITKF